MFLTLLVTYLSVFKNLKNVIYSNGMYWCAKKNNTYSKKVAFGEKKITVWHIYMYRLTLGRNILH